MEPEQVERVKSIFLRATEMEERLRDAFLERECAGAPEVRAKVERLLEQHEETRTVDLLRSGPRPEAPRTLAEGDLLAERFRIVRFVGKGGMGEVYEASDEELGGRLALKIVQPGLPKEGEFLARFRREVHLARQVTHANVCRIFDVGRDVQDGRDLVS